MKLRKVRLSRLVQVIGLIIGAVGIAGFWLTQDVQRTVLSQAQAKLVNPEGAFQASFVVAGRDYDHQPAGPMVWKDGKLQRSYVTEAQLGFRTDTIIYVNIVGNKVYMVSIPRDLFLDQYDIGINEVYSYGPEIYGGMNRAEHVRRAVAELLDVPVDYYAVINIDIFEKLVDALGGVDLEVPYRMDYEDQAGGLNIDLQPGFQHLDGTQAAGFIRYRQTLRGDIDRVDNVKTLAWAMLAKIKAQNVRAVGTLPKLIGTYLDEVESNISPALVSQLVPRLSNLEIHTATTLPINDVEGSGRYVETNPQRVESFLAELFGGEARELTETPKASVLISNRSGVPTLAEETERILMGMGIPEAQLSVQEAAPLETSQIITTESTLGAANYYADLLGLGVQQIDRFEDIDADIEIVLGQDARTFFYAQLAQTQP